MTSNPIPAGKLPVELLAHLLGSLGQAPPDVLLGPAIGEDACALGVGGGALVAATDPITLTAGADLGRSAVVVNANDVAVCGVRPRWFLAVMLLPAGAGAEEVERLFESVHEALAEVGGVLVGGHTEVTTAVTRPVVVGQMLGFAEHGRFVTTSGARAGDVVVQVGAAPVEGAAVLAADAAARLTALPPSVVAAARNGMRDPGISVVHAALTAASLGATAMHDPTEGGLAAGLHELARAAGVHIRIDPGRVEWWSAGLGVCQAIGADPWATLASGTLLATFPAPSLDAVLDGLTAIGVPVAPIGTIEPGRGVSDTGGEEVRWPERDEVARLLAS